MASGDVWPFLPLTAQWLRGSARQWLLTFSFGSLLPRLRIGLASPDTLGVYLVLRAFVIDADEIVGVLRFLIIAGVVVSVFMLYERFTGRNLFGALGGVPEITEIRDDQLRAQGPFPHPLLAGFFGAFLLPAAVAAKWQGARNSGAFFVVGVFCSVVITFCSASSGPIIAFVTGVIVILLWRFRGGTGKAFYFLAALLVVLHLAMKAPVWALIARVKVFGGSTAYHRFCSHPRSGEPLE